MPRLTATAALQLALLLSAVPAQYLISRWSGSTAAQRFHSTARYGTARRIDLGVGGCLGASWYLLVRLGLKQEDCHPRKHCCFRLLRHWNRWRASYLNSTVWMDWAHQQMVRVQ